MLDSNSISKKKQLSWGKDRPPPGWQNYGGYQQQQNWNNGPHQMQYRGNHRNNAPVQNTNVFGIPAHLTNGYAFHNTASSMDPHANSAVANQWNQQAAITAQQQQRQLYDQYNANPNNL